MDLPLCMQLLFSLFAIDAWSVTGTQTPAKRGSCTNSVRVPDFYIAGVQKGGTTAMRNMMLREQANASLCIHNDEDSKPLDMFLLGWSGSEFPGSKSSRLECAANADVYGIDDPDLIYFAPKIGPVLTHLAPNTRFVVLLREPVQRAFSAWEMFDMLSERRSSSSSFDGLIRSEIEKLQLAWDSGSSGILESRGSRSLVEHGVYSEQLQALGCQGSWDSRCLVLVSEWLRDNPLDGYNSVFSFLGLPTITVLPELTPWEQHDANARGYAKHTLDTETGVLLRAFYNGSTEWVYGFLGERIPAWESWYAALESIEATGEEPFW